MKIQQASTHKQESHHSRKIPRTPTKWIPLQTKIRSSSRITRSQFSTLSALQSALESKPITVHQTFC